MSSFFTLSCENCDSIYVEVWEIGFTNLSHTISLQHEHLAECKIGLDPTWVSTQNTNQSTRSRGKTLCQQLVCLMGDFSKANNYAQQSVQSICVQD